MEYQLKRWNTRKKFALSALSVSLILMSQSGFALQELNDSDLSNINGQDGVDITLGFDHANFDRIYWEDKAGSASNTEQRLRLNADALTIRGMNGQNPDLNLKLNVGSDGARAGLDAQLRLNPFILAMGDISVCNSSAVANCNPAGLSKYNGSMGSLGIQVADALNMRLTTPNGLFSSTDQGTMTLGLNNLNIFLGQRQSLSAATQNQLLTGLNFNLSGKGFLSVDSNRGLLLTTNQGSQMASMTSTPSATLGYVDFDRVDEPNKSAIPVSEYGSYAATSPGIKIELATVKNAVPGVYNATDSKGLIRVGASGRIVNAYVQVRGTSAEGKANPVDDNVTDTHTLNNILGMANSGTATAQNSTVIGSSGIGFRMRGEFTNRGDSMLGGSKAGQATTLEIGGAGRNSYGFEFSSLSPLVSGSNARAYFDSGDILLNLADTKSIRLPENSVLRNSRFGGVAGTYLTSASDYVQQINNTTINPYSLIMAIRGMEFQALSKQGRFTGNTGNLTAGAFTSQQNYWGLALPIYNMNANLATYATTYSGNVFDLNNGVVSKSTVTDSQRLGLSLGLSTQGRNADGSKTTSIMLIDGGPVAANANKPVDYYLGLRNIDMLLRGYGSMGFENGHVNLTLPDLLMVMSAELAAGYLPGAKYKTANYVSPLDNFKLNQDILLGIKIKLLGDMGFALIPNNAVSDGSMLSIVGDYAMTDGAMQLSDPVDGSMIGLDNLSGKVRFNNSIGISKKTVDETPGQQGNVSFNYAMNFNPENNARDVFRVRDINFYPPNSTNTTGQRLGEMVITGGRLSSNLTLSPRN